MTNKNPALRPTAEEALQRWKVLRHDTWGLQRLWRPRPRDENPVVQVVSDAFSLVSCTPRPSRRLVTSWLFRSLFWVHPSAAVPAIVEIPLRTIR